MYILSTVLVGPPSPLLLFLFLLPFLPFSSPLLSCAWGERVDVGVASIGVGGTMGGGGSGRRPAGGGAGPAGDGEWPPNGGGGGDQR